MNIHSFKIKNFMQALALIFLLSLFFSTGCKGRSSELVIGIVPSETPEKLRKEFGPVRDYLQEKTGLAIKVYIPDDYRDLIVAMKEKRVDIGLFGPFSYIIADSSQELTPLLVRKKKEFGVTYNSVIITRKNSPVKKISDLRNRKMAFVNTASTSGYIVPQSLFISRNINIETFFSGHYFTGSHDISVKDVISGKADAAAVSLTIMKRLAIEKMKGIGELRIIWKSDSIPGSPYIARSGLDKRKKELFTTAMLDIHRDAPDALRSFDTTIEKYVPISEGLYNSIRNIVNILGNEFIEKNYL